MSAATTTIDVCAFDDLGDGRIVVILDIGALVRADWRLRPEAMLPREKADSRTFVLVVDDSITVRRVTQRLLERNDMRVLTARDGVDAARVRCRG